MNTKSHNSRISIYSLHTKCSTVEELLTQVGQYLIDNDVVQGDFVSALQTRERSFPTGLELDGAAIAIPHVEATYCRRTALLVATNNYPLPFNRMDNPSAVLSVRTVILLAINDPHQQVAFLSALADLFGNRRFLQLINADSEPDLIANYIGHQLLEKRGESYA